MFKASIVSAFLLASGLISAQAHAALVPTDWKSSGDKLATLHTETGIEWLNLTLTDGLSMNEVSALLSSTYKGWRLPTPQEVETLFYSHFGQIDVGHIGYKTDATTSEKAASWQQLFGVTGPAGRSFGRYINGNKVVFTGVRSSLTVYLGDYRDEDSTLDGFNDYDGVFLVSDGGTTLSSNQNPTLNINNPKSPINQVPDTPADVPVHAGFGVLGLLLMLFGLRRQVKGAPHA